MQTLGKLQLHCALGRQLLSAAGLVLSGCLLPCGCTSESQPSDQRDAQVPCVQACLDAGASSDVTSDSADAQALPTSDAGAPSSAVDAAVGIGDTRDAVAEVLSDAVVTTEEPFAWRLPKGFPPPPVPADNPMSHAKVTLGRHLFYDKRLSRDGTQACASCHRQELAFTDGLTVSPGVTGQLTPRSSMMLGNVAYASTLTWANPLQLELERQALVAMFSDNPVELGLRSEAEVEENLAAEPIYHDLFTQAFPDAEKLITTEHVVAALAAFERTLISGDAPFDRFLYGQDADAISVDAQRGYELFNSEKLECFHCHVGFNLSDHTNYQDKPFIDRPFHNTGLYNIDGKGAYPAPNTGVHAVTGEAKDMGRFRAPSLRNIAVTAPYMHDGSIATLDEVLDHYAAGGRRMDSGPNQGDGSQSPLKSSLIIGFELTADERRSVLAFFDSLTDQAFLSNPEFADPWPSANAP